MNTATTGSDITALLEPVVELAREPGRKKLDIYNSEFAIQEKEDKSPLTEADMASHHAIVDGLATLTPDVPVLSEDSAGLPFAERAGWKRYWLVVPLDGTGVFI
ncbi:MAG: 3'(2'),5'-bisphosphate nucleotidase CysQ, partial [Gammaproteobacteria bacterium]